MGDVRESLPVVVVMVPFPAQGHLNQMLHLSRLVTSRAIRVHFVGSAKHIYQAKKRVQGWDPSSISSIHFHDFPLPPSDRLQPSYESSLHFREPLSQLLHSLSSTAVRITVIYDTVMAFAAKEASLVPNCQAYALQCASAFSILFFSWEGRGRPNSIIVPSGLPHLSMEGIFSNTFLQFMATQVEFMGLGAGNLYNTCKPIEDTFIDLLSQESLLGNKKQWAIGPLHPVAIQGTGRPDKCLDWLDAQPLDSVLYISFGSNVSIPNDQITEIAIALERSKQRFIWVLRKADRRVISEEGDDEVKKPQIPDGYEERLEGRGMIVKDWAPQLQILAHPSTGGFLSHCGWNSCIESMSMGVPMATWPMHSDQPRNSMLVTEVLKIGLVVREWENRGNLLPSVDIENSVKKLMVLEEGKEMKKRAKELGIAVREAVSEGGSSTTELDSFLNHISGSEHSKEI